MCCANFWRIDIGQSRLEVLTSGREEVETVVCMKLVLSVVVWASRLPSPCLRCVTEFRLDQPSTIAKLWNRCSLLITTMGRMIWFAYNSCECKSIIWVAIKSAIRSVTRTSYSDDHKSQWIKYVINQLSSQWVSMGFILREANSAFSRAHRHTRAHALESWSVNDVQKHLRSPSTQVWTMCCHFTSIKSPAWRANGFEWNASQSKTCFYVKCTWRQMSKTPFWKKGRSASFKFAHDILSFIAVMWRDSSGSNVVAAQPHSQTSFSLFGECTMYV